MNTRNQRKRSGFRTASNLALTIGLALAFLTLSPQDTQADTISFDALPAGTVLSDQFAVSHGVTFSGVNNTPWHPDRLAIFDTNNYTGGDVDLSYAWAGGNLAGQRLGMIFVIAEDVVDRNHDGLIDDPDDEARGGRVTIQFDNLIESFRFDQIDRDDSNGDNVQVYKAGALLETFSYNEMATMDSSIEYGDRKANRMPWITSEMAGDTFDEIRINVCGSHGFDSMSYNTPPTVPEPATMMLLACGAAPIILKRRRNK